MGYIRVNERWHDLRIDPDDLPDDLEEVLATIENFSGTRRVLSGVYLKPRFNDAGELEDYCWCIRAPNERTRIVEETMLWYPVIAWAYYPDPYPI